LFLGDTVEIHKKASLLLNTAVECLKGHKATHVSFQGDYLVWLDLQPSLPFGLHVVILFLKLRTSVNHFCFE